MASTEKRNVFHRGHYNIIAKRFRVALEPYMNDAAEEELHKPDGQLYVKAEIVAIRGAIVMLAIDFCKRFVEDSDEFDPIKFLNACSPNPLKFLLSTLWEEAVNDGTDNDEE